MLEFILKYWLEILFTIITSSVAYILKGYMSLKNGLKSLLKNEIIRIYETYMKLGYCPNYMKDNISEIYKNYKHLDDDGIVSITLSTLSICLLVFSCMSFWVYPFTAYPFRLYGNLQINH